MQAVEGRCDVYLDGGVRQGTDVLKALALGAKAVFIGRPVLWGLACEVTHARAHTQHTRTHAHTQYILSTLCFFLSVVDPILVPMKRFTFKYEEFFFANMLH